MSLPLRLPESQESLIQSGATQARTSKITQYAATITVEPYLCLVMFCSYFAFTVQSALVYAKLCNSKFNESVCAHLSQFDEEEDVVQTAASHWTFYLNLAFSLPVVFTATVIGPLSDRYGRSFFTIFPPLGFTIASLIFMVNSLWFDLHVYWLIPANFIQGLGGSFSVVQLLSFTLLSDLSKGRKRTKRIGIAEGCGYVGSSLGLLLSGVSYEALGFAASYAAIAALQFATLCYTYFWIHRIVGFELRSQQKEIHEDVQSSTLPGLRDFFRADSYISGLKACVVKRSNGKRFGVIATIFMLCILQLSGSGESNIAYLYTKSSPLNFSGSLYGYFLGLKYLSGTLGCIVILPFVLLSIPLLADSDLLIIVLSCLSRAAGETMLSLATKPWLVFMVPLVSILGNICGPTSRSHLSKSVQINEFGAISSIVSILQTVLAIAASALFNNVYPLTLHWWPGACFALIAVLIILGMLPIVFLLGRDHHRGHLVEFTSIS